jgi:hypothetical protein
MKKILLYVFAICCIGSLVQNTTAAQCGAGQSFVTISILTDNYGAETNWQLTNSDSTVTYVAVAGGTYANNTQYTITACVPSTSCTRFRIGDTYGDGICCAFGTGVYYLIVDGDTVATGGNFGRQAVTNFNCPPGTTCADALVASTGSFTAPARNTWYAFTPTASGMYELSTCGTNSCDTRLWVYENCQALIDNTNQGTIFFNDNFCGAQSTITGALQGGLTYYIRIGDNGTSCAGAINWQLTYLGPITGCMDPTACNYNPLATVSDGNCLFFGDPNCPNGPDLVLRQDVLASSLQLVSYNSTDACLVPERCVSGMGARDIIRFTTHIENNGTTDYYVGIPNANNSQFTNNNCHGHWHYDSYAEYLLFDQNGTALPIGMKNGFCVLDLTCDNGGTAQYGCGNMGISAGCGDIYDRSLMCQWVDVTTIPDGSYTLVVRVNWLQQADFLGRYEMDYNNNWGQVCITLSRATGTLQMTTNTNCPVYTDCAGVPYGNSQPDCAGVCNGTGIRGDYNQNTTRELSDVNAYVQAAVSDNFVATECVDLFRDTIIDVYDAALLARCLRDAAQCNFPQGIYNPFDTVSLAISNIDFTQGYADIVIRTPSTKVHAYQFSMSGITIDSVVSLQPASSYPVAPVFDATTGIIAGLPTVDTSIARQFSQQNLCRVYFSAVTAPEVCIASIDAIVSSVYQTVAHKIESGCVAVPLVNVGEIVGSERVLRATIAPNPMKAQAEIRISGNIEPITIVIFDAVGREIMKIENYTSNVFNLDGSRFTSGVYYFRVSNSSQVQSGKFSVE